MNSNTSNKTSKKSVNLWQFRIFLTKIADALLVEISDILRLRS